jgi:hypothetical protein
MTYVMGKESSKEAGAPKGRKRFKVESYATLNFFRPFGALIFLSSAIPKARAVGYTLRAPRGALKTVRPYH